MGQAGSDTIASSGPAEPVSGPEAPPPYAARPEIDTLDDHERSILAAIPEDSLTSAERAILDHYRASLAGTSAARSLQSRVPRPRPGAPVRVLSHGYEKSGCGGRPLDRAVHGLSPERRWGAPGDSAPEGLRDVGQAGSLGPGQSAAGLREVLPSGPPADRNGMQQMPWSRLVDGPGLPARFPGDGMVPGLPPLPAASRGLVDDSRVGRDRLPSRDSAGPPEPGAVPPQDSSIVRRHPGPGGLRHLSPVIRRRATCGQRCDPRSGAR